MQSFRKVHLSIADYTDYMFNNKNLIQYYKNAPEDDTPKNLKQESKNLKQETTTNNNKNLKQEKEKEKFYKVSQTDSLFWCFYIMKNGFSNYEMEIGNQHFVIEKSTKLKYVEQLKNFKDQLKLHKIKPYSEIEDDLANKEKISIKTFFALCVVEGLNAILVDKRKIYQILCSDSPMNIIHRDPVTGTFSIETDINSEIVKNYLYNYYMMSSYDDGVKSMASYKVEEILDLLKRIKVEVDKTKKMSKKDYYELLVQNF